MKTKRCNDYFNDIVAHVADSSVLGPQAAAHLADCARCQDKVAGLKRIAAIHQLTAHDLPEPKHRLTRRQLERSFERAPAASLTFRLRPVVFSLLALIIAAAIYLFQKPLDSNESPSASYQKPGSQSETKSFAPTILALRHQVLDGREQTLASSHSGSGIRHYRLGDVEIELRN